MTSAASEKSGGSWVWGPLTPLGLMVAAVSMIVDQAHKAWMLHVYEIGQKGTVRLTPFFDLVLVWNEGISYGLFPQDGTWGQAPLIAIAILAAIVLFVWLARLDRPFSAIAVGLVMGGALGNAIDRGVHGAVADFFSLHAFGYHWYVFNIADVAIVAGVVGLVAETLFGATKRSQNLTNR